MVYFIYASMYLSIYHLSKLTSPPISVTISGWVMKDIVGLNNVIHKIQSKCHLLYCPFPFISSSFFLEREKEKVQYVNCHQSCVTVFYIINIIDSLQNVFDIKVINSVFMNNIPSVLGAG